jgi:hypothetical protein
MSPVRIGLLDNFQIGQMTNFFSVRYSSLLIATMTVS